MTECLSCGKRLDYEEIVKCDPDIISTDDWFCFYCGDLILDVWKIRIDGDHYELSLKGHPMSPYFGKPESKTQLKDLVDELYDKRAFGTGVRHFLLRSIDGLEDL